MVFVGSVIVVLVGSGLLGSVIVVSEVVVNLVVASFSCLVC